MSTENLPVACAPCQVALDRVEWAAALSVRTFGVRVGVRVDDAALLPRLREHLPPACELTSQGAVDHLYSIRAVGTVRGTRIQRFFFVYSGSELRVRTVSEALALSTFETSVRADVARSAARWTFVHAGAVAWKDRAIVIPGPCGAGKSRLVEALVRAGATYYSDEFAVIDSRGRVHPFAKPITLRHGEEAGERSVTAGELGGTTGTDPVPVGLVASLWYEPDARTPPRAVSAGEALFALLPHTLRARIAPRDVLKALAHAVRRAAALQGARGEADDLAPALLRLVE